MTRTKSNFKGFLALLVTLSILWAMCLSCVSYAVEVKTFPETIKVTQTLEDSPSLTTYTYHLVPKTEGAPMPEGSKNGVYEFRLTGEDTASIEVELTADGEHDYQYELKRVEKTPDGDTVTPYSHLFGFLVKANESGSWKIIPYTCYDNEFKIWDKVDAEGNPVGITLPNTIKGTKTTTSTTTKTTPATTTTQKTPGTTTRTVPTTKTNVVTRTVSRVVNTGDPYMIGFWVGLLAIASGALVILGIVRRKKEKDEEES